MKRHNIFKLLPAFLALLLVCGCASDPKPTDSSIFKTDNDKAKVFLYAVYDDPEDLPTFEQRFRFYVDKGYLQDISIDQFIETKLIPGKYVFEVDHIGWAANILNHSVLKLDLHAGENVFLVERVRINKKPILTRIDSDTGVKDVMARTRACLCGYSLYPD